MKKYISRLLALILCLCAFVACDAKDSYVPSGFQRISNDNADYRFYVPNGWIADLSTGVTAAYVSEKDRSSVSFMGFEVDDALIQATFGTEVAESEAPAPAEEPAVSTTEAVSDTVTAAIGTDAAGTDSADDGSLPTITTPAAYWAYYEKNFKATFSDMTYEIEGENMLLSGLAAKKYVYTATVTGEKYQFMQVVTLKNGYVYIFTYTSTESVFDSHLEDINAILGYIEIK